MSKHVAIYKQELAQRAAEADMSGTKSLFGTIGGTIIPGLSRNQSFIPTDSEGGTITISDAGSNPRFLGLDTPHMQFLAYNFCSPLAAVIDRIAEADANAIIKFVKDDGSEADDFRGNGSIKRIKKLFSRPNPLQTFEEFDSEQTVYSVLYGYCPVLALSPFGMDKSFTRSMWNLSPTICRPVFNNQFDVMDSESNPISYWEVTLGGQTIRFNPEDIMIMKDGHLTKRNELGLPISKVVGLDFYISNLCVALEADNVLLRKRGPLGIFSYDPKPDMAGWTAMTPGQQTEIQDDLRQYGMTLGQFQYIVTKLPLKFNQISFNARDLMTKETIRAGTDAICDRLGYPAELMSGKNATYENRDSAERYFYQNRIIPFSLRRTARYNQFFELDGIKIKMCYDHLPVLQDDILKAAEATKFNSEGLDVQWKSGVITMNEFRLGVGKKAQSGMDIYYPEWFEEYGKSINQNKGNENTPPKNTGVKK